MAQARASWSQAGDAANITAVISLQVQHAYLHCHTQIHASTQYKYMSGMSMSMNHIAVVSCFRLKYVEEIVEPP